MTKLLINTFKSGRVGYENIFISIVKQCIYYISAPLPLQGAVPNEMKIPRVNCFYFET